MCCSKPPQIGLGPGDALTLGESNGAEPVKVTAQVNGFNFRKGQDGWVTGTEVAPLIEAGWLVPR